MTGRADAATVSFTAMEHGTRDDYLLLREYENAHARGLVDRIDDALRGLASSFGGYQVTRLEHSLQSATRARHDGADADWVVAALIHDVGDDLAPFNHSEFAASILRPYVRAEVTWVVEQHGVFQSWYYAHHLGGDRDGRDAFADHPWYGLCLDFCARWDQASFDPGFRSDPLESFRPELDEVFGRDPHDPRWTSPGSSTSLTPAGSDAGSDARSATRSTAWSQ